MTKEEIEKAADEVVEEHYKIIDSMEYVAIGDSELLRAAEKSAIVTVKAILKSSPSQMAYNIEGVWSRLPNNDYWKEILQELKSRL